MTKLTKEQKLKFMKKSIDFSRYVLYNYLKKADTGLQKEFVM